MQMVYASDGLTIERDNEIAFARAGAFGRTVFLD
jgi:hypothetical protein